MPTTLILTEMQERIADAAANLTTLRIRGSGSKDFYGNTPGGEILDTRRYAGVIDYEPSELVLSARCGTPLSEIEALLDRHGQMLAFEPPHFGPGATLGGCVASGLSGPRRQAAGSVRDFVLGAKLLDGRAQVLSFGGRVMKNVAGYDLSRALAGSLGVLGIILDVSVKVLPRPVASITLQFECDETSALRNLNHWGAQPLPITASAWHAGILRIRLAGASAAVQAARAKLGGELIEDAEATGWWHSLREQTHEFFTATPPAMTPLWRLSLASTTAPIALPGEQLIEWGGALRWWKTTAEVQQVRAAVPHPADGHACLFRAGQTLRARTEVFTPLSPALARIHQKLKAEFDPARIFNPGRLYADL